MKDVIKQFIKSFILFVGFSVIFFILLLSSVFFSHQERLKMTDNELTVFITAQEQETAAAEAASVAELEGMWVVEIEPITPAEEVNWEK